MFLGRNRRNRWHQEAIRRGNHRLVNVDGQDPALFDLEVDPFEQTELLEDGMWPEEAKLLDALNAAHAEIKALP